MAIVSWKTNLIGLGIPPKVISGTASGIVNLDFWPYSYSTDDPYYSLGSNPKPYRFRITFNISNNAHGSHLSRTPYVYNAQDVEVGDFVAGADDGKVLQVMSIVSKTENTLVAICEDRLRYNTYRSGSAPFNVPGNVIFFQINELGLPMLDPIPGVAGAAFYPNVMSRFNYQNPLTNYVLEKTSHGFERGDAISIAGGTFVKSTSGNIDKFIGTVVAAGPGPDQFVLKPANGIIDFVPGLPGSVGDYIYLSTDGSGDLTTSSASKRPVYLKIADAIISRTTGTGIDPTGSSGDIVEINRIQISVGGSGAYNLSQAITAINAETANHSVTADSVNGATTATSNIANTAYGLVGGYVPFSASFNGSTVSFTTTTSGAALYGAGVADANDMAADINAASITNITASVSGSGELIITNSIGGAITIVNVSPDANTTPFAGASSISGLALSTSANTSTFVLRLTRTDGGPLTLRDVQGSFFSTADVMSGQNGRYALGLNIEQGVNSGSINVVADITARDALSATVGDMAYVIDAGNSEWAQYVYTGSAWQRLSNQRSDAVDAQSLVLNYNLTALSAPITNSFQAFPAISANRVVQSIKVLVTTACPSGTTVSVGTSGSTSSLASTLDFDLTTVGQYQVDLSTAVASLTTYGVNLNASSTTAGQFTVILTYV
jgi:hypothetical protein